MVVGREARTTVLERTAAPEKPVQSLSARSARRQFALPRTAALGAARRQSQADGHVDGLHLMANTEAL
jgi:hypothetical protein